MLSINSCWGWFLYGGLSRSRCFFPLSFIRVSLHLLTFTPTLSWMDVHFKNQNPYTPFFPGVFHFLVVALSNWKSTSAPEPTSSLYDLFFVSLMHSAFLLLLWYFTPQLFCFLCIRLLIFSSYILHWLDGRIFFRYFVMSCLIYIAWPCPGTFCVSLFLPISSDLSF